MNRLWGKSSIMRQDSSLIPAWNLNKWWWKYSMFYHMLERNIKIMNTEYLRLHSERLKMVLVIQITNKTSMTATWLLSQEVLSLTKSLTDFFFHLYYGLRWASFQGLLFPCVSHPIYSDFFNSFIHYTVFCVNITFSFKSSNLYS